MIGRLFITSVAYVSILLVCVNLRSETDRRKNSMLGFFIGNRMMSSASGCEKNKSKFSKTTRLHES